MYDIYGSPGFLAAYNAGPRRLDDYLSNNRPLPDETRRYVAMIGPNIVGGLSDQPFAGRRLCDECAADRHPARDALRPCDAACQQSRWRRPRADARTGRGGAAARTAATGGAAAAAAICDGAATTAAAVARRIPIDPAGGGRAGADASWRCRRPGSGQSRSAPIPASAWRMRRSAPRASAPDRAGGRAHLGVRRAPGRARACIARG